MQTMGGGRYNKVKLIPARTCRADFNQPVHSDAQKTARDRRG